MYCFHSPFNARRRWGANRPGDLDSPLSPEDEEEEENRYFLRVSNPPSVHSDPPKAP